MGRDKAFCLPNYSISPPFFNVINGKRFIYIISIYI